MESNVFSWEQFILKDIDVKGYKWQTENIPIGEYEAVLDFKIWSKKVAGIDCYFRISENGKLLKLTLFRLKDGTYRLNNGNVDFNDCPTGATYLIGTAINGKGNISFKKCLLLKAH